MNPKQKSALAKIFAVCGTLLLLAPILFMLVTAVVGSIARKALLFDYLMLAELFPLVALGLVLLVLASITSRILPKWIGWSSAAALILLAASLLFANASGLSSGTGSVQSGAVAFVIVGIALYDLLVLGIAILGILLVKKLFQKQPEVPAVAE
jgi:hypothetical protein